MQDTAANCGPASLSNALAAVGVVRTQQECEGLCRTTAIKGTDLRSLQAGIKAVGRTPRVLSERRFDVAYSFLCDALRGEEAAVLCVDKGDHWVAAIGLLGERVLIADSADNELVLSLAPDMLKARWLSTARYYGVIL